MLGNMKNLTYVCCRIELTTNFSSAINSFVLF